MKNKKILTVLAIMTVILLGVASVAYALDYKSNAEIVAGLTGKSVEEVNDARAKGESYGEQAADAKKLEEFKDAKEDQMKARLDELVKEGRLTREEADARLKAMEERMKSCTGTGENMGQGAGAGCGLGAGGQRNGTGAGANAGTGPRTGGGFGGGRGGRGMMAGRTA